MSLCRASIFSQLQSVHSIRMPIKGSKSISQTIGNIQMDGEVLDLCTSSKLPAFRALACSLYSLLQLFQFAKFAFESKEC